MMIDIIPPRVHRDTLGEVFSSPLLMWLIIFTRPKPAYGRQGLLGSLGQDTDQAGTFSGVLNISLRASSAELGFKPTWNH